MSKFMIRVTIIIVSLYLIACYAAEMALQRNIWSQSYYLLFELCTCLCISKQGVYHCKFIKWTAYSILASDILICIDNVFDIFSTNFMVVTPPVIIMAGLLTTTTLAIRHYHRVRKLKRQWNQISQSHQSYKNL